MTTSTTVSPDPAGMRTVIVAASLVGAAGLTAWSGTQANSVGFEWWRYGLGVSATVLFSWLAGSAVVHVARLAGGRTDGPFLRVLLGLVSLVCLNVLIVYALPDAWAPALLAVASIVSAGVVVARRGRLASGVGATQASLQWLGLSALLAVSTSSVSFVDRSVPGIVRLTQYWDHWYHLAVIKAALRGGFPLAADPLVAGAPAPSYHVGFDAFAETMVRICGANPDATYFGLVAPLLSVLLIGSVCAAAWAIESTPLAAVAAGALFAVTLWFPFVPGISAWVVQVLGDGGFRNLAYFYWNPPAALAAAAGALSVAVIARGDDRASTAALATGAVLIGASMALKANAAIAFVPAYLVMIAWSVGRGRTGLRAAIVAAACLVASAGTFYLTTRGASAPLGVDLGEYSRWGMSTAQANGPAVLRAAAGIFAPYGLVGAALFLAAWIVVARVSWQAPLIVAALLGGRDRRGHGTGGTADAAVWTLASVFLAFVVGMTLVQPNTGRFTPWNISDHTVANVLWIGLLWAAVGTARLARQVRSVTPQQAAVVGVVIAIASAGFTAAGLPRVRQVSDIRLPSDLYSLLVRLPRTTPPTAVIVQDFDVESNALLGGIGGRQPLIERGASSSENAPAYAIPREDRLRRMYSSQTAVDLERSGDTKGVSFAIVGPSGGLGLKELGTERDRNGDWVLVKLP